MADDNGKERVTMAVLGERMETLTRVVSTALDDAKDDRKAQAIVNKDINTRVTRVEERIGIWQIGQAAFTTLAASVAAVFG